MKFNSMIKCCFVALFALTIFSCKDDDEPATPKSQFVLADGSALDLAEANLYLMSSGSFSNDQGSFDSRYYYITDGTFVEGDPWDFDSYTNATFFIEVDLNVPDGNEFVAGNFPLRYDYSEAPANKNFSYLYLEFENRDYYESFDVEPAPNIVVGGGLNNNNVMSIEYNGDINFYEFIGEGWDTNTVIDGKFFYKGTVQDKRLL